MSSPLTRLLGRLFPRDVRERYGDELLDLQHELRERGEISRAGLIRDAVHGAILSRVGGRRAPVIASVLTVLAVSALTAGMIAGGSGPRPPGSTDGGPLAIAKIGSLPIGAFGRTCLVGSSSSCSLPPCTEYVVLINPTTGKIVAKGSVAASLNQRTACAATPSRPLLVPVHG